MKVIPVYTYTGIQYKPVYEVGERPYKEFLYAPVARKFKRRYINIPCSFDIETTTIKSAERPFAFMYHWQMAIGEFVFFGRTWGEWLDFLKQLREDFFLDGVRRLVVYVFNLPFEFQFFRRFVHITESFCRGMRDCIRCLVNGVFEFRCAYALTNKNLEKFIEDTPGAIFRKNDGAAFDYNKLRLPSSNMTETEESYCYCDVAGLVEGIRHLMEEDDLASIPMTSTGYVRRDFRNEYRKNKKNRVNFKLRALDKEQYIACRKAFRGGDTHANILYVDEHLHNITSYDISSSYPATMLYDLYPMGAFFKVSPKRAKELKGDYALLLQVRFEDLRYIGSSGMPYIPIAKCEGLRDFVNDNGRVLSASLAQMWLTDIDYDIIKSCYTWTYVYIHTVYAAKYGPLPDEHKKQILAYFEKKTKLKGVDEYDYMKSKNRLNSSYGMMVTDIAKPKIVYKDGEYHKEERDIEKALTSFYKSRNSFLSYQHGLWVTARARKRIRVAMDALGRDLVYVDTDSVKFRGKHADLFEKLNADIIKEAEEKGYYADDKSGKRHYIGAWEFDGFYTDFKTLGAKRYLVKEDGKIKTTIAGVNKKAGAAFFSQKGGFKKFKDGVVIKNAGHIVAYYNDDAIHTITIKGEKIVTASNVALVDDVYTLGMTGEYLDLLEKFKSKISIYGK